MKKNLTAVGAVAALAFSSLITGAGSSIADEGPGSSAANPYVVTSLSEVPEGAVEDKVSTYLTDAKCDDTRSWVLTVPAVEETFYDEARYKRDIPAVEEVSHSEWKTKERTREVVPGEHHEAVTHEERKYTRTIEDTKTVYWFAKYTQTREGKKGSNGKIVWGEFGPWTKWSPETHTSWQDSTDPLGSPAPHASGKNGSTYWERVWQARFTGVTKEVPNGSHPETTDWLTEAPAGDGWKVVDTRTVTDSESYTDPDTYTDWSEWTVIEEGLLTEPTVPEDTDTHEYKVVGPKKVVDTKAVEGYTEYYVEGGEPSLSVEDASWVKEAPEGDWTQFESRKVGNDDAKPEVVTYYAYSDGEVCPTVTPPTEEPPTSEPPVVTTPPSTPTYLAQTGAGDWMLPAVLVALALIVSGGVFTAAAARRRQH